MTRKELREKDREVLRLIAEGNDDVQEITSATTLENHEVNYAFEKLEQHGLIQVERPDGMVERMIDGQKRVFQAPKQAELTREACSLLEKTSTETEPLDLTEEELMHKVNSLENRVSQLENQIQILKKQFQDRIR